MVARQPARRARPALAVSVARAANPIAATTVNVMLCDFFMWASHALRRKYAPFSGEMEESLTSGRNSAASGPIKGLSGTAAG
jgi:hypothetical protein